MPERLATVQQKISLVSNKTNQKLLKEYDAFMNMNRLSESRRMNNLKTCGITAHGLKNTFQTNVPCMREDYVWWIIEAICI